LAAPLNTMPQELIQHLPPPPSRDEFEAELHACFQGDGAMSKFARWRGVDKSQISREVSPRYPDESLAWQFVREWLDPLHRADAATAERVWALLSRYNARYTQAGDAGDVLAVITLMNDFLELLCKAAVVGEVAEADLKDRGLRMLEVIRPFVDGLRHEGVAGVS
jgi:hypothetical protein